MIKKKFNNKITLLNKLLRKKIVPIIILIFLLNTWYQELRYTFYKPDLTIIGPIDITGSISGQAIEAIKIYKNNLDFNVIASELNRKYLDDDILKYTKRGKNTGRVILFESILTSSLENSSHITKFKSLGSNSNKDEQIWISYSMFESTAVFEQWVELINKNFDMLVVPDEFLVDIYTNSGVIKPIFVLPLSINYSDLLEKPVKTSRNQTFTFGNFSATSDRKNHIKLLEAFAIVNKARPDTHLLINSRYAFEASKLDIINFIRKNNVPNIQYAISVLPPETYSRILSKIDAFVYPAKGEGFSIQPREAMAMGVPTIITNNTAQTTICKSGLAQCVESNIIKSAYYDYAIYPNTIIGNQFDCKAEDLAAAMIKVYDNYDQYLKKSEQMREWAKLYTRDNLRKKYLNMVKPQKIILGDKNEITDDYLMTDSQELYEKYLKISNENK